MYARYVWHYSSFVYPPTTRILYLCSLLSLYYYQVIISTIQNWALFLQLYWRKFSLCRILPSFLYSYSHGFLYIIDCKLHSSLDSFVIASVASPHLITQSIEILHCQVLSLVFLLHGTFPDFPSFLPYHLSWPLVESLFSLIHSYLGIVKISALDFVNRILENRKLSYITMRNIEKTPNKCLLRVDFLFGCNLLKHFHCCILLTV